ncbi:MAG TPA: transcriptional regulator [Lachnospiraceae bacterium]|jgi:ArsR family transcriptional regulator|nr:transcriptional regulator [Lachnospiraceae bacterium]
MPGKLSEEMLAQLSDLYKMFADRTRIRILYTLLAHERCVSEISRELEMTQSAISHQLSTLKASKLVKARRDGKTIFYSLDDEHVEMILSMGVEHICEMVEEEAPQ